MTDPLVSVICLCYNQARFIREAVASVLAQTYPYVELIIVDDASTDGSAAVIRAIVEENPGIRCLILEQNAGNCRAFNKGLALTKGDYIIDLAADDLLLPRRIESGVQALRTAGPSYGVSFTDADWIDENGHHLYKHSDRFPHDTIPRGDIYRHLVERFFICSPTVMFSKAVMAHLGGYDENLSYEDFDFWIRSSRHFLYHYTPEVLVKKRVVKRSLSEKQFRLFSRHLDSTFRVCRKVLQLNRSREEQRALQKRILYEIRLSVRLLNFPVAWKYMLLLKENRQQVYP